MVSKTRIKKAAYMKKHYAKNRTRVRAYQKCYNAKNKAANKLRNLRWREANKTRLKKSRKISYLANRADILTLKKSYYIENREKILNNRKTYQAENRKKIAARRKLRYRLDIRHRIHRILATRMRLALQGIDKAASTVLMLGCSINFFQKHIEKQFLPGMTWENYGSAWHIDHILPCAEFHLQHSEEQEICFHYTNLQPLWAEENLKKGAKYGL